MGKNVPLEGPALEFVRGEFARYYRSARVDPPLRFGRREFAAFPFARETMMRRHAAFRTTEEFRRFLTEEVPRHVYYSSAYYRQPDLAKMAEKGWLGADLIFDLDADHLKHAESLDYPGQLALVKRRFQELLEEFLFGDFGIDPDQTTLVFSGGRGYHVHVHDPRYLELTSAERREIVDYILGVGVDPQSAVAEEVSGGPGAISGEGGELPPAGSPPRRLPVRRFQMLVDPAAPGWPGRVSRSFLELVARWEALGATATARELGEGRNLAPEEASRIARRIVKDAGRIRAQRTLEAFRGRAPQSVLEAALSRAVVEVQGETDAPVTTDIHRLIRLPRSLHGGSGLVVRPLTWETLDDFDPLRDAVPDVDPAAPVPVVPTVTVRYPFGPGTIATRAGEPIELPPPAAVFLLLRGEAEWPTPPAGPG